MQSADLKPRMHRCPDAAGIFASEDGKGLAGNSARRGLPSLAQVTRRELARVTFFACLGMSFCTPSATKYASVRCWPTIVVPRVRREESLHTHVLAQVALCGVFAYASLLWTGSCNTLRRSPVRQFENMTAISRAGLASNQCSPRPYTNTCQQAHRDLHVPPDSPFPLPLPPNAHSLSTLQARARALRVHMTSH